MVPNQGKKTAPLSLKYLYNRIQFGTLWKVYLRVMAYDLVYSSMYLGISPTINTRRNLLDVASNFPWFITDRHPCRKGMAVITGARWRRQLFFRVVYPTTHFLAHDLRICGLFRVTYIPGSNNIVADPLSHPADKPLVLSWKVGANGKFAINLTVLELEAPSSYGCDDARIEVYDFGRIDICPNMPRLQFIGTNFTVKFFLNYHGHTGAWENGNNNYVTKILFQYQILDDRNVSLNGFHPGRYPGILHQEYTLRMHSNNATFLHDSPVAFVGEFPRALVYFFSLMTKGYATPTVVRKNVACDDREAEIIFYDGYLEFFSRQFHPILKLWSCIGISDGNVGINETEEVRGSMGILSIVVFVPRIDKHKSFYLIITWQAEHLLPSIFRLRRIQLELSQNKTIHLLPRQSTALEVVHIAAPKGKFVRLWLSDIKYISYRRLFRYYSLCQDGIFIDDLLEVHISNGLICSNSTAENIVKQSKKAGLTVGRNVIIELRQYWWIASISATIIASIEHCVGYINLLPLYKEVYVMTKVPGGIVSFDDTYVSAEDSYSMYNVNILIRSLQQSQMALPLALSVCPRHVLDYNYSNFKIYRNKVIYKK